MKNLFKSMMAVAVAAMSFAACSTDVTEEIAPVEKFTVKINAVSPESRTVFGELDNGEYPTLWEGTEKIKVALNCTSGKNSTSAEFSDDGTTAVFTADLSAETTAPYTVYAVSPASVANSGISSSYLNWTLIFPDSQKPTATSCDPAAQVLVGQSAESETRPTSVDVDFKHLTAYAKINFTNVSLGTATVNSVTITADQNIAGKFYYQVADKDSYTAGQLRANAGVKTITVTTSDLNNVWVAVVPTAVSELTFTINTDQGAITKEVTGLEKEFKSGVVATFNVDMTGKTIEKGDKYTLVTDLSVLAEGDNVIIVSATENYAVGKDASGYVRNAVAVTKDDNVIIPTSTVGIFTIHDAGTNLYAFKDVSNENHYLYDSSTGTYNNVGVQATNNENGYWDITIKDATTGAAKVVSQGTSKVLQYNYNNGNPRFTCYGNTQKDVALYYKSNGGAKIAIDPQIIPAKTAIEIAATDTYAEVGLTVRGITGDVDIDWDTDWIDDAEVTDNTLYLTILENTTSEARDGSITISGGGASATITVSQLGAVTGATVYTLTNKEICDWLTANNSTSNSYVNVSIESESGVWTANMSAHKNNTFIQFRNKSNSFIKTPVFDKPIKSISFKVSTKQTTSRNIYVVPTNATFPSGDTAYSTSNILTTNYGNVATGNTGGTVIINLSDTTQNQVMIVAQGGATYVDEISVTCAD